MLFRSATGTFYIYFESKTALYLYILEQYQHSIRTASSIATEGLTNRVDIEKAGLKPFIKYVLQDKLAYKIIWESLTVDYNIFRNYYESFSNRYVQGLSKAKEVGQVNYPPLNRSGGFLSKPMYPPVTQ